MEEPTKKELNKTYEEVKNRPFNLFSQAEFSIWGKFGLGILLCIFYIWGIFAEANKRHKVYQALLKIKWVMV